MYHYYLTLIKFLKKSLKKKNVLIPYALVFALVFALAELHNMSQGSSRGIAAASSSGVCSAVSCGQVKSKDVLYSDD